MPPRMQSKSPSQAFPPGSSRTIYEAFRLLKADGIHYIKAKCIFPRFDLVTAGCLLVPDVEGSDLTLQKGVFKKGVGRVSVLVRWIDGQWYIVYDVYVYYPETDRQEPGFSSKSGVYADDLLPTNQAQPIHEVMKNLHTLFSLSGNICGHALLNEQQYLRGLPWSEWKLYDIQRFSGFSKHAHPQANPRIPSLKVVASKEFDGWIIQTKQHDSTVDCRATGEAFYKYEAEIIAEQSTPEFQSKLLWVPNCDQKLWAQDATVRSLGALAWHPATTTSTESDSGDLTTSVTQSMAAISLTGSPDDASSSQMLSKQATAQSVQLVAAVESSVSVVAQSSTATSKQGTSSTFWAQLRH